MTPGEGFHLLVLSAEGNEVLLHVGVNGNQKVLSGDRTRVAMTASMEAREYVLRSCQGQGQDQEKGEKA